MTARNPRRLGLVSASALVVASMVGAGVFTSSGFALEDLGTPGRVLFAWAVGGASALSGALCYGALARAMPESGGEYTYLARTLHPLAGFLAGWVSMLAGFTGPIAVAALGLQAYLDSTFELGGDPRWIGTGAILTAGALHGLRLAPGVVAQNAAVGLKLALIAVFLGLGASELGAREPLPRAPAMALDPIAFDPGALAVSLVWISFAYSGWNAAAYVAGEVRDPERNLPRALLAGTLLVTAAYLALNAVFVHAAPLETLAGKAEVGAIAAEALGGPHLRRFLTLIVALALFTSVSSMVMAGPRVYARMAADGYLPRFFAFEGEVPGRAILLQVVASIAVVWVAGLRELIGTIGFTLGLCAAAAVVGCLRLRAREGPERVRVPGYPLVPLFFLGTTLFASAYLVVRRPGQAASGLVIVALGLLFARLFRRTRAPARALDEP
jgi:APA family basic amino acid/polyamine antiporter